MLLLCITLKPYTWRHPTLFHVIVVRRISLCIVFVVTESWQNQEVKSQTEFERTSQLWWYSVKHTTIREQVLLFFGIATCVRPHHNVCVRYSVSVKASHHHQHFIAWRLTCWFNTPMTTTSMLLMGIPSLSVVNKLFSKEFNAECGGYVLVRGTVAAKLRRKRCV